MFAIVTCVAIIAILLATVANLPAYGDASNPANNEVSRKYIEDGIEDTGAVNIVAGMILDYRAFDTLGESHVLFIAAVCVMILLKIDPDNRDGRNYLLQVCDDALLSVTGGIVQGMSGSPIVQDGRLVGAVTHVLVDDPTIGYGISIENMLAASDAAGT